MGAGKSLQRQRGGKAFGQFSAAVHPEPRLRLRVSPPSPTLGQPRLVLHRVLLPAVGGRGRGTAPPGGEERDAGAWVHLNCFRSAQC